MRYASWFAVSLVAVLGVGCGGSGDETTSPPSGSTGGSGGSGGTAGASGTGGSSGTGGVSGTGGSSGTGGAAGSGTDAGPQAGPLAADRVAPWRPGRPDGIPSYPQDKTACKAGCDYTTHGDDATDDSAPIQSCLNATAPGHACVVGAGTFAIANRLYVPSNVVLRGKGGATTVFHNRGADGYVVYLGSKNATFDGEIDEPIASGYTKGSTSLVMAAAPSFSVGGYIAVTEDNDPAIVNVTGADGACNWCGGPWNNGAGTQVMAQIVQVTGISGTTVTLDRPLYFTFLDTLRPVALRMRNFTENAGVEDVSIAQIGAVSAENQGLVTFDFCSGCWAKNVDLSGASSEFVEFNWSKGCVLRDSYVHDPQQANSGRGYGAHVLFWNSDHLVENNVFEKCRHSVAYEGGGSGCVIGYNYLYRDWESDSDPVWLGDDLIFHGAHPYMNLAEGNIHQQYIPDNIWGSSSHNTYFRNQATASGDWPQVATENRKAVVLVQGNYALNALGNVLGTPGTPLPSGPSSQCGPDALWSIGCKGLSSGESPPFDPKVLSTLIHCGNYSLATAAGAKPYASFAAGALPGVDGDCTGPLPESYYLAGKPSWFGSCPWPPIGPDVTGFVADIPAKRMREQGSYTNGCP